MTTTWVHAATGFGGTGLASYIALASDQVNGTAVLVVLLLGVLLPALLVASLARETPAYGALAALYGSLAVLLVIVGVWTVRLVKAILSTNFFFA